MSKPPDLSHIVEDLHPLAVPADSVHADPANVNVHDDRSIRAIMGSLARYGQRKPIVVNRETGTVEAGNGTLEAARRLGWEHIAVVRVEDDPTTHAGFAIADNRTAQLAHFDNEALGRLIASVQSEDPDAPLNAMWDDAELKALMARAGVEVEEEAFEAPEAEIDKAEALLEDWPVEPGDVWRIASAALPGQYHRLICGDATRPACMARLLGGAQPALVFADPPYGLGGYAGRSGSFAPVEGDDAPPDQLRQFFATGDAPEVYVCCEWRSYPHLLAARGEPRSLIVWAKPSFGMGRGYRRQHEFIGYYGDFDASDESDLWLEAREVHYEHPTQKPVALPRRAIENSTTPGTLVLDPFAGSGTTFVAAEQTGRLGFGVELLPKYCAVTLARLSSMGLTCERDGAEDK